VKHHKQFAAALLVSIQERRELYPEMTDPDVLKALRAIAGRLQASITRQRTAERAKRFDEALRAARFRQFDESKPKPSVFCSARAGIALTESMQIVATEPT